MLDDGVIATVLAEALRDGGDHAELFVEDRESTALKLEDGRLEDVSSGRDRGAGIRLLTGGRASYAYTNLLTSEALLDAARVVRAGMTSEAGTVADLRSLPPPVRHPVRIPPAEVASHDKAAVLTAADEGARAEGGEIRQVVATYLDVRQRVLIAASDGRRAEDDRTRVRLGVRVVAGHNGDVSTGFEGPGHLGGYELFEDHPPFEVGRAAAGKAVRMLGAEPSPAGELPVVLASGYGSVLIHEACGHGLEGDTLAKDASVYAGREGERFASEQVTIVDDASDLGAWGGFGFDDEGTPAQRTVLLDRGVLVGHMSDLLSASKLGRTSSGNGRRQSYAHLPVVRMTNTYLLEGPDDPEAIVASVDRGVYAATFAGGEVNPATGNFVFGMSEAYLIEKGEITRPIRGATLIGDGPTMLGVIDAVGNDAARKEFVCGKDGQHAFVTNAMPTVLLGRVTVGGTEA
ncbi:MAG: TldD/PmbA family protein [Actinomycetota bacterium]